MHALNSAARLHECSRGGAAPAAGPCPLRRFVFSQRTTAPHSHAAGRATRRRTAAASRWRTPTTPGPPPSRTLSWRPSSLTLARGCAAWGSSPASGCAGGGQAGTLVLFETPATAATRHRMADRMASQQCAGSCLGVFARLNPLAKGCVRCPLPQVCLFSEDSSRWLVADQGIMACGAADAVRALTCLNAHGRGS